MSTAEMIKFFDKSLKGILRGSVVVGGREYPWHEWTGEKMASKLLAIDTETELIELGKVPRMALATVFDGEICWLVHPRRLSRFLQRNSNANFIAHNAAFDWHVIYRHLLSYSRDMAKQWLAVVDQDRLTDTMLLDQLVRIAYGSTNPVPRNLAVIAERWAQVTELDKEDPWRLRYSEILDVPWKEVDRDAWRYAAKDPIATRLAFLELRRRARKLVHQYRISKETVNQYGPLSIRIQVKAAIALQATELRGIRIDQDKRIDAEDSLRARLTELVHELDNFPSFEGIFRKDQEGQLMLTPGGKPRMLDKRLRQVLGQVADKHGFVVEKTATGSVSKARSIWEEHADAAPFIASWLSMEETAKLLQFFRNLQQERVHPHYCVVVRTGRTSCSAPNIQQMPRAGTFREMFVPKPGHAFLIIDYNALELRTLATVCLDSFGYSVLGETIQAGRDPHCYTASLLSGLEYEKFVDLKSTDPAKFKQGRQAAKAVNFGVPGGLSSDTLRDYARTNYQVDMSPEDASEFRQRFLNEIYPEIGQYMTSDLVRVLARNVQCTSHDVLSEFPSLAIQNAAKRIVQAAPKKSGEPYDLAFEKRVWKSLQRINRNDGLTYSLANREAGPELEKKLFFGPVTTLTGRVRGRTTYTQRHNTPFQGLAADGAKLAVWNLYRAGIRVVAHIHDEFVVELPVGEDLNSAAQRIDKICCDSMRQLTGAVPIECEYVVASCWSKRAELLYDDSGKIQVWKPQELNGESSIGTATSPTVTDRPIRSPAGKKHAHTKSLVQTREPYKMIKKPIKIHGGKRYLIQWIIDHMPPHLHYVEPFFGGGSVLLARDPNRDWLKGHPDWSDVAANRGASEVVNDISDELTNFWRVLQDEDQFERFRRKVSAMPFSSVEWHDAAEPDKDPVSRAVAFFVRARQSMAGRQDCFTPLTRKRTRGKRNGEANAWWNAIKNLPVVHLRLQGVVILKDDAIRVIQQQDNDKTLFYLDPPYVHSTRTTIGEYSCEMTNAQHKKLLDTLAQIDGKFMLSGYRCDLYDRAAAKHGWNRHETVIDNKASSKKTKPKKVECIWTNYA